MKHFVIQSILVERGKYPDIKSAIDAANRYGIAFKVDVTPEHYRFRQLEPNKRAEYRTVHAAPGIQFVMMSRDT